MTRLAIFDLNGTLLNTIGDLAVSCNAVLALRGLPQHSYEDYCRFVGNGIMRLVERALPEALRTPYTVDAVRRDFVAYYLAHIDEHTLPYEGIPELLDELQRRGVRLAVASNKFQAGTEKLIGRYFPDIRFDVVLGQRPDVPRIITIACFNEWSEGHYLLPDNRFGYGMLEALAEALGKEGNQNRIGRQTNR